MIFVVVPAYNEEKNIGRVVRGLFGVEHGLARIDSGFTRMRVVMVDDGSEDKTAAEAKTAGAEVVQHKINRGQGAALQTGDEYALKNGAEIVVHFDADGQFNPADILPAITKIKNGECEAVFGSRFLDSRSKIPFFKRYFVFPLGRWLNNFLTGAKLTDVHNGFRVFSRSALEKIEITQDGMAHNTEITARVKKSGLKFLECPTEVVYSEYGQGIGGGLKILWDLIIGKIFNF